MNNEPRQINRIKFEIVLILLAVSIGTALLSNKGSANFIIFSLSINQWLSGWLLNFSTEMFGSFITFILIDFIIQRREKLIEESEKQKQKYEEEENRRRILQAEYVPMLKNANNLSEKQDVLNRMRNLGIFQGINLWESDLSNIILEYAKFQSAHLVATRFTNAVLDFTNFQGAYLEFVHFENASLQHVDFRGANLASANFKNADILGANFDQQTTLPNGILWTPNADLHIFTDPQYDGFWQSPIA